MRFFNSLHLQVLRKIPTKAIRPDCYAFSSLTKTPTQTPNTPLFDYLIQTLTLSKAEAQSITNSTRFSNIKSLENPHSVLHYFRSLGFSDTDIRSSVISNSEILLSDVDMKLKPRIEFFQEIGLVGSHLGKFISNNSRLLDCSLENMLIPCTQILKNILVNDTNNQDLIRVLSRCSRLITKNPEGRLLSNIAFLESCGIVGSQLSMLLKNQPRIFVMEESKLKGLVSRVLDMGFSFDSIRFVHGLRLVSCLSEETLERKLEVFRSFGFTKDDIMEMFQRLPSVLNKSEEQLKLRLDFFMNNIELKKEALIREPCCLTYSQEDRVIPRYKVMSILKLKKLLKDEPSFVRVLTLSEEKFLEKYVQRFRDDLEELLVAYKGHMLDSETATANGIVV
ncbi:hypothetical protein EZV62_015174 [Acer yangbiense]|uniref:Uncharacterized protein n=1 Tax=Acer yangbiense TaxID=1000413 RepID=A0A5C7HU47_9ROSI|nr:hypothetical protein EZV62_015174 [Acer yangbiense]